MSHRKSMNHDTVADMAFYACTLEECLAAEKAMVEWLREHPDDLEMYELCSQLALMKLGAEEEQAQKEAAQKMAG